MNENQSGTPNPLSAPPATEPQPDGGILDANPAELTQDVDTVLAEAAKAAQETTNTTPDIALDVAQDVMRTKTPDATQDVVAKTPDVAPDIAARTPEVATEAATRTPDAAPTTTANDAPSAAPVAMPVTGVPVSSLDPTGRPMEQVSMATEPAPKRNRGGLILGIVGGILLICGIVAAVVAVILMTKKSDPVMAAMQKIMSGEAPKNIAVDGDIDILVNSSTSPIKRININLDSDTIVGSMINTSSAVLTLTDRSNNDYSAEFDELYAANGDLYFRIKGATELLEDENFVDLFVSDYTNNTTEVDCIEDGTGGADCVSTEEEAPISVLSSGMLNPLIEAIESIDGVWLRMSTDQLSAMGGNLPSSSANCVTEMIGSLNKNSNSTIQIYNKYPFISSTDKNVVISSKQNPVYQVFVDSENFTNFINAMSNTELAKTLYSCMGWNNNATVTEEDVAKIVNAMPKFYTEVNSNDNFSRIYFEADISDGAATLTADLGLSYPTNVNVSEPVEYTDYQSFIQTLFMTMYSNVNSASSQSSISN